MKVQIAEPAHTLNVVLCLYTLYFMQAKFNLTNTKTSDAD